jgi:cobyrinic acid a,c-diamide synthase
MSYLYISAAHKSSGKTTLTLGLARALRDRGLKVQAFKKGPDYIDPIWHAQASGRPSYNLDFHMMAGAEIDALFARHATSADVSLIEGNKGLYDGMDVEGSNSNAALAKQLGAPVVLVLDTIGMTRGIAPLLLGYQAFDPALRIAGVILNKVGGPRHEEKLRAVLARYTTLPCLGAVPKDSRLDIQERHLGLIPGTELEAAETRIQAIALAVMEHVDLDALLAIAAGAAPLPPVDTEPPMADGLGLRIAYARDRAFGFYYQEDLDSLRDAGAELLPVDTLADSRLPDCDALLLGGGFPEMFIPQLASNRALLRDIRQAVEGGLPTYAECGGLMYLARSIAWNQVRGDMVGVVPGDVVMGERPVGRGYAMLRETAGTPFATTPGQMIPAHEFHYSRITNLPTDVAYAYEVARGHGMDGQHDGFHVRNLLAAYCHRRGSGKGGWIAPLLTKARIYARQHGAARIAA